jgi:hypothetical protein
MTTATPEIQILYSIDVSPFARLPGGQQGGCRVLHRCLWGGEQYGWWGGWRWSATCMRSGLQVRWKDLWSWTTGWAICGTDWISVVGRTSLPIRPRCPLNCNFIPSHSCHISLNPIPKWSRQQLWRLHTLPCHITTQIAATVAPAISWSPTPAAPPDRAALLPSRLPRVPASFEGDGDDPSPPLLPYGKNGVLARVAAAYSSSSADGIARWILKIQDTVSCHSTLRL